VLAGEVAVADVSPVIATAVRATVGTAISKERTRIPFFGRALVRASRRTANSPVVTSRKTLPSLVQVCAAS
jgi:hypothetical protein